MCGRFTLHLPPELLAEIFGLQEVPSFPPRYNIAPTQQVPVIRQASDGRNRLDLLRWGLIPSWAKDKSIGSKMINARSETLTEKPSFRQAIKYRRCLVPSSAFYEWKVKDGKKIPFYIHLKDGFPMVFAGLWDHWKSTEGEVIESFTILTISANPLVTQLHDRMPVILHPEEYDLWMDRHITDPESLKPLYQPYPADLLEMYPVSPMVNSPKNESEELIQTVCDTM